MTLDELIDDTSLEPTILDADVEARVLRAIMADFELQTRPEDEAVGALAEKLMDSRTANVYSDAPEYLKACAELAAWRNRNADELARRWPDFLDMIDSFY